MDDDSPLERHQLVIDIFKQIDPAQGAAAALSGPELTRFEGEVRRASTPVLCLQLLTATNDAERMGLRRLAGQLAQLVRTGIAQLQVAQQHDATRRPAATNTRTQRDGLAAPEGGVQVRKGRS